MGVDVVVGVAVGPSAMGSPLQAVRTSAMNSPDMVRRGFMGVLILVNGGGVNGRFSDPLPQPPSFDDHEWGRRI
jgi:hypothetical protein